MRFYVRNYFIGHIVGGAQYFCLTLMAYKPGCITEDAFCFCEILIRGQGFLNSDPESLRRDRIHAGWAEENTRARPTDDWTLPDITVRNEDVEVALLREKQQRRRS